MCAEYDIPYDEPWSELAAKHRKLLLDGGTNKRVTVRYKNRYGRVRTYNATFEGIVPYLRRRHTEAESDSQREQIEGYMREVPCPACDGARPESTVVGMSRRRQVDLRRLLAVDRRSGQSDRRPRALRA